MMKYICHNFSYYYYYFFFISETNPSNSLAFKSWLSSLHCPDTHLLCSIRSIIGKTMGVDICMSFLSPNSYLCLPYHSALWELQNLGSFLNLIIWYFPTTACLPVTCQISFCSHLFCVCRLDDNSGWCKSLSAFDSENVIKKENTKEQPHVLAVQASIQLLYQTNIGGESKDAGCSASLVSKANTNSKGQTAHLWQTRKGINYWIKASSSGLRTIFVLLLRYSNFMNLALCIMLLFHSEQQHFSYLTIMKKKCEN